jgi:hypothetical protein
VLKLEGGLFVEKKNIYIRKKEKWGRGRGGSIARP